MSEHLLIVAKLARSLTRSDHPMARRFGTEILEELERARFDLHQELVKASMAFLEGRNKDAEEIIRSIKAELATGIN